MRRQHSTSSTTAATRSTLRGIHSCSEFRVSVGFSFGGGLSIGGGGISGGGDGGGRLGGGGGGNAAARSTGSHCGGKATLPSTRTLSLVSSEQLRLQRTSSGYDPPE
eukprot:scaffold20616_cov63-Phaeocystis_antarctica.AAC.2